jgi:hypothetical protein
MSNPEAVMAFVTFKLFKEASLPETITFFQLGIFQVLLWFGYR